MKILTPERICNWPDNILSDVIQRIPDLTLYVLKEDIEPELWDKIYAVVPDRRRKSIIDMEQFREPAQDGEINTAYLQFLSITRNMLLQGFLVPSQFDSTLAIPEGIEDSFESGNEKSKVAPERVTAEEETLRNMGEVELRAEVRKIRKEIENLKLENHKLRMLVAKMPKSA